VEVRMTLPSEPGAGAVAVDARAQVHVVDDDDQVRTAMVRLLGSAGYGVRGHRSAESFLAECETDEHGCIVLDIAMPGLDGLDVQQALAQRGNPMPIIFLTGQADVPMCVRAMKCGAFDFLTKPVDETVLFGAIERALRRDDTLRRARAMQAATDLRLASLTAREREVLTHVMAGRLNKQIAADLGTAEKTIKVHRARGMEKMNVRSVAELVRLVERAHPESSEAAG